MSGIACKKCPKCGAYSALTKSACGDCGEDLQSTPTLLAGEKDIPGDRLEELRNTQVFVQTCPVCGTLNFTSSREERATHCYKCNKIRIAGITPLLYQKGQGDAEIADDTLPRKANGGEVPLPAEIQFMPTGPTEEKDELDLEVLRWSQQLKQSIGSPAAAQKQLPFIVPEAPRGDTAQGEKATGDDTDTGEAEDEDDVEWGLDDVAQEKPEAKPMEPDRKDITLTSITYGRMAFALKAEQGKAYLLGREGLQGKFLRQDLRVGNEHCYLLFKNGEWLVQDNRSQNGTAVDGKDIGLGGTRVLKNGDTLKLGHEPDSMAFRVTI